MIVKVKYFSTLEQKERRKTFNKIDGVGYGKNLFWVLRKNGRSEEKIMFILDYIKEIEVY